MQRGSSDQKQNPWRQNFWRREDGSMVIFGLFLFISMFMIAGMGVDIMRFEKTRAMLQSTVDRAILAAADLDQTRDPEEVVRDYFEKAGLTDYLVEVEVIEGLNYREVRAKTELTINNIFLDWRSSPVENFSARADGTAIESVSDIEISMVLDVSGSMGRNNRLPRLKEAAKEFIDTLVDEDAEEGITSVSIVPYNATVNVGEDLITYFNADPQIRVINEDDLLLEDDGEGWTHPGAMQHYYDQHEITHCVRFDDGDFTSRAVSPTQRLERVAHFDINRDSYTAPEIWDVWCKDESRQSKILVHSRNIQELHDHIDDFSAEGNTAIDTGLKWGIALLDPAMRPVVDQLIADGKVDGTLAGRPRDYSERENMKVIVLMTDGNNTTQYDLHRDNEWPGNFKNGPSRVWFSPDTAGIDEDDDDWNSSQTHNGYFVELPWRDKSRRFYRPRSPHYGSDDQFWSRDSLPDDAYQLDYIELYRRFAVQDARDFFWKRSDTNERNRHGQALEATENYLSADERLQVLCNEIKNTRSGDQTIQIYAIGFEAPNRGRAVMQACATTGNGFYYDVGPNLSITDAFRSIASQINKLKLTQ